MCSFVVMSIKWNATNQPGVSIHKILSTFECPCGALPNSASISFTWFSCGLLYNLPSIRASKPPNACRTYYYYYYYCCLVGIGLFPWHALLVFNLMNIVYGIYCPYLPNEWAIQFATLHFTYWMWCCLLCNMVCRNSVLLKNIKNNGFYQVKLIFWNHTLIKYFLSNLWW